MCEIQEIQDTVQHTIKQYDTTPLLNRATQCRTTLAKLLSMFGSNANCVTVSYADTKGQFDEM